MRLLSRLCVALAMIVFVCFSSTVSFAKVVYVKPTGDDTSSGLSWTLAKQTIGAGMSTAVSGDEVWVAAGTYTECILVKAGVKLYGGYSGSGSTRSTRRGTTILDGGQSGTVVKFQTGATQATVIDGFQITNGMGDSGGGIDCEVADPTISNNIIQQNEATIGSGIYCLNCSPVIDSNTITYNNADNYFGGGIYCSNSSPTISNNTISENYGGGIYCIGQSCSPNISYNSITGNEGGNGGGIYWSGCSPTVSNNTISGNWSDYGGGIYCGDTTSTVSDNKITDNHNDYYGGGIYCDSGCSATFEHNTISKNSSADGAGLYCTASSPLIRDNTIVSNTSNGDGGGGIYCAAASAPRIERNTVAGNQADFCDGGGIYCTATSAPAIYSNVFLDNTSEVIYCLSSSALIINNTMAHNADGIHCESCSPTIENNILSFGTTGIEVEGGSPVIRNNCVYNPDGENYSGTTDRAGTNGNIAVDPKFADRSHFNLHIQPDSPCINAGYDTAAQAIDVDIDNQERIQGYHVDIGADESDTTRWATGPAAIVYVSTGGNDSNDGLTWQTAKKTVQAGIDTASDIHGEVWVAAGTYVETLTIDYPSTSLYGGFTGTETARSERNPAQHTTVLDGGQSSSVIQFWMTGSEECVADGFTITNGHNSEGGGVNYYYSSATLSNNIVTNNTSSSDGAGIYCFNSSPLICNNTITYNESDIANGAGICCYDGSPVIKDNVIADNHAYHTGGIYCEGSTIKILNNTISDNISDDDSYASGIDCEYYADATIANNVVAFNPSGILCRVDSYVQKNNCLFNTDGDLTKDASDIVADPKITDRLGGDYRLMQTSPCINAGLDSYVDQGDLDINGEARISGTHVDIGADEFNAPNLPANVSLTPDSGVFAPRTKVTFSAEYSDQDGTNDLSECYVLINNTLATDKCAYLYYDKANNKLYLRSDDDSAWLGGYAPGASSAMENSRCKVYCAETTVETDGNDLTVNWTIEFKSLMSGNHSVRMRCLDKSDNEAGWDEMGSIEIGQPPVNISLSPTSGILAAGTRQVFISKYADADGSSDLADCYLLINTSQVKTNGVCLCYDQANNKLYIRDDNDTAWIGGITPGTDSVIENSYGRLHSAETTVTKEDTEVTVNWSVDFKPTMSGRNSSMFMLAEDSTDLLDGWDQMGSVKIGQQPVNVSLSPNSSVTTTATKQTISAKCSDLDGFADLANSYILINSTANGTNGVYVRYDRSANKLYLRNDSNSTWVGGFAPGSSNVIENSRCKVYCAETTVVTAGNDLTVNWKIEFKSLMKSQNWPIWMLSVDSMGLRAEWAQMGSIRIDQLPANVSLSPSTGTFAPAAKQVFTSTYSDPDGNADLTGGYLLINTSLTGAKCPYIYYSSSTNKLYVRNDGNSAWVGGYAPGSSSVIENSYCKLYCAETTVTKSGTTLTVNWKIEFKATMVGKNCSAWILVADNYGMKSGWDLLGSLTIGQPPVNVSLSPTSLSLATNTKQVFTSNYSDAGGYAALTGCYLLINTTLSAAKACCAYYDEDANKLYLRNDANSTWTGGYAPGSSNVIGNSYCSLYCAETTVTKSGNNVTVNWKVLFKPTMAKKSCFSWMLVNDAFGLKDGWDQMGSVTLK